MKKGFVFASAAHVRLCECRKHGRIVTADGMSSPEFCSQEAGLKILENGAERGYVPDDELRVVRQQIRDSPLPFCESDASLAATVQTSVANAVHCARLAQEGRMAPVGEQGNAWDGSGGNTPPPVVH